MLCFKKASGWVLSGLALMWVSLQAQAYTQPCQTVAQMAGEVYQPKPHRAALLLPPEQLPQNDWELLTRNGVWFVYEASEPWFGLKTCAPRQIKVKGQTTRVMPVLLNQKTGVNAVVVGRFVIKVRRPEQLEGLSPRYDMALVTRLPNRFTAVFDVGTRVSFDQLLQTMDRDVAIEYAAPIVSEP